MKNYIRIISLFLALMLTAAILVSCGNSDKDTDTTTANTDTEAVSDTTSDTEAEEAAHVPASVTVTEEDFEVTVSTENSVISLAEIKSGDATSLIYNFKAEYVSGETKAIAYFPAICAVTILDENDNAPFGVAALRWLFDYAYMESGDNLEKEYTVDSFWLDKFTAPGNYSLRFEFEYVTDKTYFAEEYQNTPSDVYPTDKQISEGGSTYRIEVKIPLTIVE